MKLGAKARERLGRAALVVCALAAAATSPAPPEAWHIDAPLAPTPAGTSWLLVTVAASRAAQVVCKDGHGKDTRLPPIDAGAWSGTGEFFVSPGMTVLGARIEASCTYVKGCTGTMFGCDHNDCTIPPGEFVRVVDVEPREAWNAEAKSRVVLAEMPGGAAIAEYEVIAESSGDAEWKVVPAGDRDFADFGPPSVYQRSVTAVAGARHATLRVMWRRPILGTNALATSWHLEGALLGPCPSLTPCAPPPTAYVRILSVTPK